MNRITPRTARKQHLCGDDPRGCLIRPGERYLEHVVSPQHADLGNEHWWRLPECGECATRYGRGDLLATP